MQNLLLASLEIMTKQLAPFRTAAVTVTGSVHEDDVPRVGSHTEERQSFGAALEKMLLSATPCGERRNPYRLLAGSDQPPPLHYCIEQRRLANIGSPCPCQELACLNERRIAFGFFLARRTCYNNLFKRCASSENHTEESSLPQEASSSAEWMIHNPLRQRI